MVRSVRFVVLAVSLLLASHAFAPGAHADDLPSMAVFPTITVDGVRDRFGTGRLDLQETTRRIEEAVRATRRFAMFERSGEILRGTVLLEQDFAKAGQALRNAAEAGRLENVRYVVQPMVTHVDVAVRRVQWEEKPGQYRYTATGSMAVTVKVLDTTSGEIAYQASREASLATGNALAAGQTGPNDEAIVRAAAWRALATDIGARTANAVVGSLYPIQVMRVQGQDIFVNRGEGAGIGVGERYQLFSVGAPLVDPATNEKIGDAEELLGDVEVTRITPRFSVVRPVGTTSATAKAGDVLRPMP